MADRVKNPTALGRRLAISGGVLMTLAGLFPLSVRAADSSSTTTPSGLVSNITTALSGSLLSIGDYVSSGWTISLPGKHAATTVSVTKLVATIPLQCRIDDKPARQVNLVVDMPDASVTIPANDTSWHPTSSSADVKGYEAATRIDDVLCRDGALTPQGKATYTAKLVSTDTKDSFAVRFHSVDARTNTTKSQQTYPNTDCSSATANAKAVTQCNAPWTAVTSALASAPAAASSGGGSTGSGGGTGSGSGSGGTGSTSGGSASGHVADTVGAVTGVANGVTGIVNGLTGTVTGAVTQVTGKVGSAVTGLPVIGHATTSLLHPAPGGTSLATPSSSAAAQPGAVSGASTHSAPVLILPAPSQSAVLGPVPLPVPVIDSVTAGVGGALPWRWFLLLAILDLGLIVGIVIRRRLAHRDRLHHQ